MRALVLLSAFISGFAVMTLELLGGKLIAPWFGGDIYVWGSIITVFMAALSIGYLIGGRLSVWRANLRVYACIFFISALLILPMLYGADVLLENIFDITEDARYGSLLASAGLFMLPSTVMGMVSPYSVRLLTQSRETSGASAGFLYFVSTLGSALGTLATSFFLVVWFEINQIILTTALTMAGVGVVLLIAARKTP